MEIMSPSLAELTHSLYNKPMSVQKCVVPTGVEYLVCNHFIYLPENDCRCCGEKDPYGICIHMSQPHVAGRSLDLCTSTQNAVIVLAACGAMIPNQTRAHTIITQDSTHLHPIAVPPAFHHSDMSPKSKYPRLPKARSIIGEDVSFEAAMAALREDKDDEEVVVVADAFTLKQQVQDRPLFNVCLPLIFPPHQLYPFNRESHTFVGSAVISQGRSRCIARHAK